MSIENPRQEAGEPRVPDFRWLHNHGLFRVDPDGTIYQLMDHNGEPFETAIEWVDLYADAVKLGDVKAERENFARLANTIDEVISERDGLRAEIRAVLDRRDAWTSAGELLDDVADILDREPGREEPACTCAKGYVVCDSCRAKYYGFEETHEELNERNPVDEVGSPSAIAAEELAALTRPKATEARTLINLTLPDHIDGDQLDESYRSSTVLRLRCTKHALGPVTSGWLNRGDTHLIRAFLRDHAHSHVVEHQPAQDSGESKQSTPCGRPDADCGMRGGSAHCGGCRG